MTQLQKLKALLSILGIEHREADVQSDVIRVRGLYMTLPYPYPGDDFVFDYYRTGLATGDNFDNVKSSFEIRLSMDQSILLALASIGLHRHKI